MTSFTVPPTHKAIKRYYEAIADIRAQGVTKEGGLRRAFEQLLVEVGRERGWTLLAEQTLAGGKRPDAVLRDSNNVPYGHWEAKDPHDDLETEIRKKLTLNYPTNNIIFEDSRTAVLFQNKRRDPRSFTLANAGKLADLLTAFFGWSDPEYDQFTTAVAAFKDRIPDLASGVLSAIQAQRAARNAQFMTAFAAFWDLCRGAIDPNITQAAIDEMLVQHLLTERLFRTVFNNPDFTRRNVIATEIEKVIAALTSQSFDRTDFLAKLDSFYIAIERTAKEITSYADKQDFLNTVYERFFQGFAVKEADTHGIVYTPQPIVSFMCASVESVLQREFGRSLSDRGVQILDPATGTGNFIVNLLDRIAAPDLPYKYQHDLFCNEIMLLPYYIASLNIEHKYFERTGTYQGFEGLCFVDTLALTGQTGTRVQGSFMTEKNTTRVENELDAEIMVIIGNPPYNVGQENENDNNKNRRYRKAKKSDPDQVDDRVAATYAHDSAATNKNALSDAYVKFFRWATDRLGDRDGIICYVTNNSFVDSIALDGMRQHLLQDFTQIWHLDLHGNVRKNPKLSGTTHNVFGIQVGAGITIAIRKRDNPATGLWYHRVPEDWRKEQKLKFLEEKGDITQVDWQELEPDEQHIWLTEGMQPEFRTFLPMGSKTEKRSKGEVKTIFLSFSNGVKTNRDDWAYDFDRESLEVKIKRLIETYNVDVDRWHRRGNDPRSVDDFVTNDETRIKWSESLKQNLTRKAYAEFAQTKIRASLYRPFVKEYLFFDRLLNERVYQMPSIFPTDASEKENAVICVTGVGADHQTLLMSNMIPDVKCGITGNSTVQCFPYYTYDEDGGNRQENITEWALGQFRAAYGDGVSKRDIWHYVYALLHHPAYRTRYAENLKRELPRIPLVPAPEFAAYVPAGEQLAALHTGYEAAEPHPLRRVINDAVPLTWRVSKMTLSRDHDALTYNEAVRYEGIPAEAFAYRLGNRSALEWVIDQYQVNTDKRSGITSDPNRHDDPEYIARLVGQVIAVSVETQKIIVKLPLFTV